MSNVDKKSVEGQLPIRLCNYTDVYYRDIICSDQDFMSATATPREIETFRLLPGDVIITKDSETPDDIGVSAYVGEGAADLICGYHLAVIRSNPSRIHGRYLYWVMNAKSIRAQLSSAATGVTRFGLRASAIKGLRIPIPPLAQQRQIADFLSREVTKLDKLNRLKKEMATKLPERLRATMHASLDELPRNAKLGYAGSWFSGGTPPKDELDHWSGAVPWASTKDLATDSLDDTVDHITCEAAQSFSRVAPKGSILVATRGMALAKRLPLAVTRRSIAFNQDLKALVPAPGIDADYLRIVLRGCQSELLSSVVESAHGTRRLQTRHLKALRIPIPDPDSQSRIVEEVRGVENQNLALAKTLHQQMTLLQERRDALITSAISGELDPTSYGTSAVTA